MTKGRKVMFDVGPVRKFLTFPINRGLRGNSNTLNANLYQAYMLFKIIQKNIQKNKNSVN